MPVQCVLNLALAGDGGTLRTCSLGTSSECSDSRAF